MGCSHSRKVVWVEAGSAVGVEGVVSARWLCMIWTALWSERRFKSVVISSCDVLLVLGLPTDGHGAGSICFNRPVIGLS